MTESRIHRFVGCLADWRTYQSVDNAYAVVFEYQSIRWSVMMLTHTFGFVADESVIQ